MKRITVFGGSQIEPGQPAYQQALMLGRLLGQAGYTVQTGGYTGTMEAVSRGAAESGAHVIGITCDEIEAFRPGKANPWVMEELHFTMLRQRIFSLIEGCDAAIVMPGGVGTLAELAEMWSHIQAGAIPQRPLILVGPEWQDVLAVFYDYFGAFVPQRVRDLLTFAGDVSQAVNILRDSFPE